MDASCTPVYSMWRRVSLCHTHDCNQRVVIMTPGNITAVMVHQIKCAAWPHAVALRVKLQPHASNIVIKVPFEAKLCRRTRVISRKDPLLLSDLRLRFSAEEPWTVLSNNCAVESLLIPARGIRSSSYEFCVSGKVHDAHERRSEYLTLRKAGEGAWIVAPCPDAACLLVCQTQDKAFRDTMTQRVRRVRLDTNAGLVYSSASTVLFNRTVHNLRWKRTKTFLPGHQDAAESDFAAMLAAITL